MQRSARFHGRLAVAAATALAATSMSPVAHASAAGRSTRDAVTRSAPTAEVQGFRLPVGFQPEGIDVDEIDGVSYAFLGSMANGSIYRADLTTGKGIVLTARQPSASIGVESDHHGRLFVATGLGGAVNGDAGAGARVVDERTGQLLASYKFSTAPSLVNDVTVTKKAAYFTDTINPVVYELPFGGNGSLPGEKVFRTIPISGAYRFDDKASTIDGNGITPTPDGAALLVIQYRTGLLFRLDPRTGSTRLVDVGGARFPKGDGLTLDGHRLYIPQNGNVVAVVDLDARGTKGAVLTRLKEPMFDVPTNIARSGSRLYLPTARLSVADPSHARYSVVSVPVPR